MVQTSANWFYLILEKLQHIQIFKLSLLQNMPFKKCDLAFPLCRPHFPYKLDDQSVHNVLLHISECHSLITISDKTMNDHAGKLGGKCDRDYAKWWPETTISSENGNFF